MPHTASHEIASLPLGAAGRLGTARCQPVIVCFIALGINSSVSTASPIRFLAELGVAFLPFVVGLGQAAFTAGLR